MAIICLIYFGQGNCRTPLESVTDFPDLTSDSTPSSTSKSFFKFPSFKNATSKMIRYLNGENKKFFSARESVNKFLFFSLGTYLNSTIGKAINKRFYKNSSTNLFEIEELF